jgi:hypothetical protein
LGAVGGFTGAATTETETLWVCAGGVPAGACACLFSNTMVVLPGATAWKVQTSVPPAPTTALEPDGGAMNVLPFSVTTLVSGSGAWVIDNVYPVVGLEASDTLKSLRTPPLHQYAYPEYLIRAGWPRSQK